MKEYEQKICNIIDNLKAEMRYQCDKVNEQAYKRGYAEGYDYGKVNTPFTDTEETEKKAYNRGLNDAWEVIKRITRDEGVGGYSIEMMWELFGQTCVYDITHNYTPEEAIAKIKEYEDKQKQDAKIKVGDEVTHDGAKFIVLNIDSQTSIYCLDIRGRTPIFASIHNLIKTGRHFDQIAEVLAELRGAENDE